MKISYVISIYFVIEQRFQYYEGHTQRIMKTVNHTFSAHKFETYSDAEYTIQNSLNKHASNIYQIEKIFYHE